MYNFNFNESDMLSKSQNENILDDLEIVEDKEDFDYEDFVQQAIASGDVDTLILINELDIEDEEDDSLENQEVVEDDESFSIVEKDGQKWKVLSTAKGKYNAARKYNECITEAKNEVRLVSLKDLEKMNESRKNEAPANSESLFTALMSELNTIYKCEITDEGFLRCTDDGGNFIEIATIKNTDPVEMGMRVTFTDGTQSETVYYVYDNIQAVNDFIQAVFISEVNAFNDMNDVEAEEVQKEEKDDIELEDENQAQEEIDKNVEEVEEESEEEKTESLKRKSLNENKELEWNEFKKFINYAKQQFAELGYTKDSIMDPAAHTGVSFAKADNKGNIFKIEYFTGDGTIVFCLKRAEDTDFEEEYEDYDYTSYKSLLKTLSKFISKAKVLDSKFTESLKRKLKNETEISENNFTEEDIKYIKTKAEEQFKDFIQELIKYRDQGLGFVDMDTLCGHCPAFDGLSEDEAIDLVRGLGYPVLDNFEDIGPVFSVSKWYKSEDDLREAAEDYLREEGYFDENESLKRKSLNEDVIPAVYDSLIIRYKDKHDRNDFDEIVKILKDLRKTATFITNNDIKEDLEGWRYSEEDIDEIINAIKVDKNESKSTLEKLKRVEDEVRAEIEKIYGDDKDLMEYFFVESKIIPGHYDDGSDWTGIEVRAELSYDDMEKLAEKLDKVVQKYDKYAYFDMEDGGIIIAAINLDNVNESLNETTVIDDGKEFKVDDKAFDIVRKNLLDVMRGYGWVDIEQMQDYIKEEGLELTDEELIAVAKNCLKYTRIFDASELQDTNLQDIKDAYGTVIVVGDFKRLPKHESLNESDDKFNYMMLDRLRTDCEYFLGNGNGYEKHLWAGNVEDQIAEMRKIYDKLPEKPDWISLEDIDRYEKEMLAKRDSKNEVKEITRDEWNKTPKDYKMIKDGKPYLVYLDDETHATVLGPCKIIDESLDGDIVTVVDIPLVTEKLYNKLVNLLYGNKQSKNRNYEQQQNVLNFLQEIEDRIPLGFEFHADLEDYGFTIDEINAIKKIVRDERTDESLNEEKTINNIIQDVIATISKYYTRSELKYSVDPIIDEFKNRGVELTDDQISEISLSLGRTNKNTKDILQEVLAPDSIGSPKRDLNNESSKDEFKIKVITRDGEEKFYKAKDLDAAKIKFSELCIRFNDCELLQGDKVLYKQHESLNEDGTVSDMGVAPIMPASYDDIDDIDDIDDELFDITEGFLFPDADEETDEDKEEEVNSLMGAAIEDIKQGEPTASEWIEDAQYVFNSIKDDTVKNRLRDKYSQYLESKKNEDNYQYTNGWPNEHRFDDIMQQIRGQKGLAKANRLSQQLAFVNSSSEAEELYNAWKNLIPEKQFVELIKSMSGSEETYFKRFDLFDKKHKTESAQKSEASAELNKVIKDLAANDKTDVDKEINKLYKEEPEAKSNVADGSPILGATSPDNIIPTIDKAIMNKAIFAATSYANNGPQMFAKLQESFKNIDRKTLDDLMNSKDVAGIAKYLYESEMKVNKNEDTFTDPQMNVVNSNSTTVATGNSPETPKLADDIDPAPTEVQDFPKDKSEIENTNSDNKEDQLAKDSGTEDIPTDN